MKKALEFLGLTTLAKPLTSQEGHKILERDHYRCQYCGLDGMASFENSLSMTVDFVHPRSRKGLKDPANLVAACRACNLLKGHRVFPHIDEARAYVLKRRTDLQKDWDTKMAALRTRTSAATS